MKKFIFAANWKMYKSPMESIEFLNTFIPLSQKFNFSNTEVIIFPSALNAYVISEKIKDTPIKWGGQNIYFKEEGAFTGENSPKVLMEMDAKYALIGHSERRHVFHESNDLIAKKVKAAQDFRLIPILCIGETIDERENNRTNEILKIQLKEGLKDIELKNCNKNTDKNDNNDLSPIIAYEPVWAIGTGKVATVDQIKETHKQVKKILSEINGDEFSQNTPILYGGSVKPDNSVNLAAIPNVDGFLIGGASLQAESFIKIISIKN